MRLRSADQVTEVGRCGTEARFGNGSPAPGPLNQHVVGFYEPRLPIFADHKDRRADTIRRDGRAVEMDLLSRPRYSKGRTNRVAAIVGERERLSAVEHCLKCRGIIEAVGW